MYDFLGNYLPVRDDGVAVDLGRTMTEPIDSLNFRGTCWSVDPSHRLHENIDYTIIKIPIQYSGARYMLPVSAHPTQVKSTKSEDAHMHVECSCLRFQRVRQLHDLSKSF